MKSKISRYFVQVHATKGTRGTGIIYYPSNPDEQAYIFTAFHCIKDTPKTEIRLEKITSKTNGFESFQLKDNESYQILFDEAASDIAILVLPKSILYEITGDLPPLPLLAHRFDFSATISVGYPKLNKDEFMQLAGEFAYVSETSPALFSVKTHPHENLETLTTESIDAARGMSGGGLFFDYKDKLYLFGVLSEFKKAYKQFECIRLDQLNNLLDKAGFPIIPFTYASNIGLNPEWFEKHIKKTREDLGDRYTKELPSYDLPIGELFSGVKGGDLFRNKLKSSYNTFLKGVSENINSIDVPILKSVANEVKTFQSFVKKQYRETDWRINKFSIENTPIGNLKLLKESVRTSLNDLRKEIREEYKRRAKDPENKDKHLRQPYSNEQYHLNQIDDLISNFLSFFNTPFFRLSLIPNLLIKGKAGNGKSHLLGDIGMKNLEVGIPSILILGNQLLTNETPWNQVLNALNINCSKDDFLKTLNQIGEFKGERLLFMVDALNEGIGKDNYWVNYLTGFIDDFKSYPFVGLVLSIRNTYYNSVIPDALKKEIDILIQTEHHGFKGVELEAVKHFAKYFKLDQPQIPLLSPEFSNPQFLLLLCRSLKAMGAEKIPDGLNGISSIYENHTKTISQTLIKRGTYDLPEKFNLVQDALEFFIGRLQQTGKNQCSLKLGLEIFSKYKNCENGRKLFNDLIRENLFTEDRGYHYIDGSHKEFDIIRFTFERFGDHIRVNNILRDCREPLELFKKGGYYYQLQKTNNYIDTGILDALAIQIPERFGKELFEVISKEFVKDGHDRIHYGAAGAFIESLLWRKKESIEFEKCAKFINKFILGTYLKYEFWSTLLILTPVEGHPFNGDCLHRILSNYIMPERDGWWIETINHAFSSDYTPLSRLIEWTLDFEDYHKLSKNSIRLTSQTLIWCLSSPNRALRDSATITLIKLLKNHLDILLNLLKIFEKVDDLYILERLYAVSFGCITHSKDRASQKLLVEYVYKVIFKRGKPPLHLLLRDYARSIVEFGIYIELDLKKVDISKVQPPYEAKMPYRFPSEKAVMKYKIPYDSPDYKKDKRNSGQNYISSSTLSWDFNRYTIGSTLGEFYGLSNSDEAIFKDFKRNLKRSSKLQLNALITIIELDAQAKRNARWQGNKNDTDNSARMEKDKKYQLEKFIKKIPPEKRRLFKQKILPLIYLKIDIQVNSFQSIQPQPIARWIVEKVFKLGWDKDLHADFDIDYGGEYRNDGRNHYKYGARIERIGKKYQWISFFDILARIADNYPLKTEWNTRKMKMYNGPWERLFTIRDIDPTLLIYKKTDEYGKLKIANYDSWHLENWVNRTDDLPLPEDFLEVEIDGKQWIQLRLNPDWTEPVELGKKDYEYSKNIRFLMRGYFVKKNELKGIYEWMNKQRFMGDRMPKEASHHYMFEKEFYWSPHYLSYKKEAIKDGFRVWRRFLDSEFKGVVPYEEYSAGGGGFNFQDSIRYYKPSEFLFNGMQLKYGEETGEFLDVEGNLVVKASISAPNYNFLIEKSALMAFLKKKRLALCWTLSGEKLERENGGIGRKSIYRIVMNGAYYMSSTGEIVGGFKGHNPYEKEE